MTTKLYYPEERQLFTCLHNHLSMSKTPSKKETKIIQYTASHFAKQSIQGEKLNEHVIFALDQNNKNCLKKADSICPLLTAALRDCACIKKPRSYLDIVEGATVN